MTTHRRDDSPSSAAQGAAAGHDAESVFQERLRHPRQLVLDAIRNEIWTSHNIPLTLTKRRCRIIRR